MWIRNANDVLKTFKPCALIQKNMTPSLVAPNCLVEGLHSRQYIYIYTRQLYKVCPPPPPQEIPVARLVVF